MPRHLVATFLVLSCLSSLALAEETVSEQAERLATQPTTDGNAVNFVNRKAKLTEEQALNQLRYMTVEAWKRIEGELNERGSFKAFGLTLSPQGEFTAVHVNTGDENVPNEVRVNALVGMLKEVAASRSVWAVGLMYVTGERKSDGTIGKRIGVVGEHIAGWARAWSYPYKVDEGGVRLGPSKEVPMNPVYFVSGQ